jgi:hypothetical protein
VRDPRLYVDVRRLSPPPERPDHERLAADFGAAVGGDSAASGFRTEAIEARRDVLTMPGDRVMWERLELSKQDGRQERDSVLRERIRATRSRNDADRRP